MKHLRSLALLSLAAVFSAFPLHAGEDNTAAYVKSHIDENLGDTVDLDVMAMRVIQVDIGNDFVALAAWTWDDKANSLGGGIAVVAPVEKKDSLLKKYGTTTEWDGRRDPETKRLRGTLQVMSNPRIEGASIPYIDLTDGAFVPNDVFAGAADVADRPGGGRGKL